MQRLHAIGTAVLLSGIIAACAGTSSTPTGTMLVASVPPNPTARTAASSSPSAPSVMTPCRADLSVTGGYIGEVHGLVESNVRRIGDGASGVAIDTRLSLSPDHAALYLFSVFDADGSGPKPLNALFGQLQPDITSRGWVEGLDPGTGQLVEDGTSATFDFEFGRIGVGPASRVVGTLACVVS